MEPYGLPNGARPLENGTPTSILKEMPTVEVSLEQQVGLLVQNLVRLNLKVEQLEKENSHFKQDIALVVGKVNSLVDQLNELGRLSGYDYDEEADRFKVL